MEAYNHMMEEPTDLRPVEDRRTVDDHGHDLIDPLGAAIVTVSSSRGAHLGVNSVTGRGRGEDSTSIPDESGDTIARILETNGHRVTARKLVPDEYVRIQTAVSSLVEQPDVDLVVTTGGTGVTIDDVTPDAVAELFDRALPGFGELFRRLSYEEVGTRVVATRAVAGIVRGVPVFVLPGSSNAVQLATEAIIIDEAPHLAGLATRHQYDE